MKKQRWRSWKVGKCKGEGAYSSNHLFRLDTKKRLLDNWKDSKSKGKLKCKVSMYRLCFIQKKPPNITKSTHFYFHHSQNYAFPEEQEYEKGLGSTFESIAHGLITETEAGMRLTSSVLPQWRISSTTFRPPKLMLS